MSTAAPPLDRTPPAGPAPPRTALRVAVALAATALAVVAVVLCVGVWGDTPYRALGVSAPSTPLRLAVPLVRAVVVLAAGLTVGSLVAATGVLPSRTGARALSADGYAAVRRAGAAAALWALAASVAVPLTVVVGTGGDARVLAAPGAFLASVGALQEPAGFLVSAVAAGVVAVMCLVTFSWRTAVGALGPALLAVLAPIVTGHAASAGAGHDIVLDSAVLTGVAGAAWLGTAAAVARHRALRRPDDAVVTRRARRVALVCAPVAVAGGIVVDAYLVHGGWTGTYGVLAVAELLLLVLAAAPLAARLPAGWTVTALGLAGVAAALTASGLPPGLLRAASPQETLIGFDLPGPPGALTVLLHGRVSVLLDVAGLVLADLYVAGLLRVRRRAGTWPPGRTTAWLAGCALLVWTTTSGFGEYAKAMFSVHMGSHMLLSMAVPILLVLGGPMTLALRALPPSRSTEHDRSALDGPREWLGSLFASPVARLLTHPVVVLVVFVGSFYALYFTPIFAAALPYHWAHQLLNLSFVGVGYLFFWPIVGVDPSPRPLPHVARLALLLASMPFDAFFGVALYGSPVVIGQEFYGDLALPWVPNLLADQSVGGGIAWAAGEIPLLLVVIAVLVQWSRHDDREGARHDRDDGGAYDTMLADLARRRH